MMIAMRETIATTGVWYVPFASGEAKSAGKGGMMVDVGYETGESDAIGVAVVEVDIVSVVSDVATREDSVYVSVRTGEIETNDGSIRV